MFRFRDGYFPGTEISGVTRVSGVEVYPVVDHQLTPGVNRLARVVHNGARMKTPIYSLIVQSEDKNRTILEIVSFVLLTLSAVASIWHAAVQPVVMPEHFAAGRTTTNSAVRA
jgi:hypothetical protein